MKTQPVSNLACRIVLEMPPPNVNIGIQKGKGSHYQTEQIQRSKASMEFEFYLTVKWADDHTPIFGGDWAQGSPKERFVYLDIGTYAGQQDASWGRRLKVPIHTISAASVQQALSQALVVTIRIPGTGKDGGPTCGTYKSPEGWQLMQG
ncbi:MAG: DUF5990 family protein [Spirosomataceae bacterium]